MQRRSSVWGKTACECDTKMGCLLFVILRRHQQLALFSYLVQVVAAVHGRLVLHHQERALEQPLRPWSLRAEAVVIYGSTIRGSGGYQIIIPPLPPNPPPEWSSAKR